MSEGKKPQMHQFRCTVHNIHFAAEPIDDPKGMYTARCPYCSTDEMIRLREARDELKAQRDRLLAAIDVAKLVEARG